MNTVTSCNKKVSIRHHIGTRKTSIHGGTFRTSEFCQSNFLERVVETRKLVKAIRAYQPVHRISPWDLDAYGDIERHAAAVGVRLKPVKPISNLGIVIGCFVTGVQLRLHALASVVGEPLMWRLMIKQPRAMWGYAKKYAAVMMREG